MKQPREEITPKTCLSCGACCVALQEQDAFADVEPKDLARFSPQWIRRNVLFSGWVDYLLRRLDGVRDIYGAIRTKWHLIRKGPLKGVSVCACVALRGNVMNNVSCSIYEKRPSVCHKAVVPGDKSCRQLRQWMKNVPQ